MNLDELLNDNLLVAMQSIVTKGVEQAAEGFSGMLGQSLIVDSPKVKLVDVTEIPSMLGGPENEAVGIYLASEGTMCSQFMLILPYQKALELVDLLMEQPTGTTEKLGSIERSALAEVGNITSTMFLNAIASQTGYSSRPTPPAVMVDMVGAILDIIVATTGGIAEKVLLLQTTFNCGERALNAEFWVVPDPTTLKPILEKALQEDGK
ncbi:MAG: hypothetical protein GYA48_10500 [Chloroflexi bacterium]|nr:hypothetical protein [Chloroflexota bacterium]